MQEMNLIVREPLLDPKQRVVGYELSWQQAANSDAKPTEEELETLLHFAVQQFNDDDRGWLLGDKTLLLEMSPAMLSNEVLPLLPAKSTVLTLNINDFSDPATREQVRAVRAEGFGISLRGADLKTQGKLLSDVSYVEVRFSGSDFATQARTYAALKQTSVRMVGRPVTTWQDFDACAQLGLDAFVGKLHLTPRPGN